MPERRDEALEARLRTWFVAETKRAEADLHARPVRLQEPLRRTTPRLLPAPLGLMALVVMLVLVGALASGIGSGGIGLGPDGIPTRLEGQPVLRPGDVAAYVTSHPDATPFLVGGYGHAWAISCPSTGPSPLLPECDFVTLSPGPAAAETGRAGPGELALIAAAPLQGQLTGRLVVRVHSHDPRAAACPAYLRVVCDAAVVAEAVVWRPTGSPTPTTAGPAVPATPVPTLADGIPATIGGRPVLSVAQAVARVKSASDASPFLVGGWFVAAALMCAPPTAVPTSSLTPWCNSVWLTDFQFAPGRPLPLGVGPNPPTLQPVFLDPSMIRLVLDSVRRLTSTGRVVLRVHTHDPIAASCATAIQQRCQQAVVVDALLWADPSAGPSPSLSLGPASPDGIPSSVAGEPVLRGQAIVEHTRAANDDTPFLIGGWTPRTPEVYYCPFAPLPSPTPSAEQVLLPCGALWFLDAPGDPVDVPGGQPPWIQVPVRVLTSSTTPAWGVPFVLRVHLHDNRAVLCPNALRAACEASLVADQLVWQGPAAAQPSP